MGVPSRGRSADDHAGNPYRMGVPCATTLGTNPDRVGGIYAPHTGRPSASFSFYTDDGTLEGK
jgi:hypothetical protein